MVVVFGAVILGGPFVPRVCAPFARLRGGDQAGGLRLGVYSSKAEIDSGENGEFGPIKWSPSNCSIKISYLTYVKF